MQETQCIYETELLRAASKGNLDPLRSWLTHGRPADVRDPTGCSLLMGAAALGNEQGVELLLAAGAAVDAQDDSGATALARAALANSVPIVRRLLAADANPELQAHNGETARTLAADAGFADVLKLLASEEEVAAAPPEPPAKQPEDERRTAVQACRERGNALFASRDFVGAAAAYTEALEQALRGGVPPGDSARILANRAACALKTGRASDALGDARLAVRLDPGYAKAHYRLGAALEASGDARGADELIIAKERVQHQVARLTARNQRVVQLRQQLLTLDARHVDHVITEGPRLLPIDKRQLLINPRKLLRL